jgi:hypothetical protein
MHGAVDRLDPAALVLLFEPNAGPEDWADAWFLDSLSLAQWLSSWLEGAGWWEEDFMLAEGAPEPVPWLDASRRLAADGCGVRGGCGDRSRGPAAPGRDLTVA